MRSGRRGSTSRGSSRSWRPGTRVRLRGRQNRFGFAVESYDLGDTHDTADFAPVYPASEELSQKQLRGLVEAALAAARAEGEPLPAACAPAKGCRCARDALVAVHRPRSLAEAEEGRRRLAFDELLVLQLALARRSAEREALVATALPAPGELAARYRGVAAVHADRRQEQAIAEIDADLGRTTPMQRLLQGDVGSGKTVVALYALLRAAEAGRQGALMAPTEVLAEQHFLTVEPLCTRARRPRRAAHERAPARRSARSSGSSRPRATRRSLVGTHALIQKEVEFRDLAVAVVDEQHRFGVEQRQRACRRARRRTCCT